MNVWHLFLSGFFRHPKDHLPWLQEIGEQQKKVKADTAERKRSVEELERHLELLDRQRRQRGARDADG